MSTLQRLLLGASVATLLTACGGGGDAPADPLAEVPAAQSAWASQNPRAFRGKPLTVEILCDCPAVDCPAPKVQNPDTCQCECQDSCRLPQEFDANCNCICPFKKTCAGAKSLWDDTSCACVCPAHEPCPGIKVFNDTTCSCECPSVPCPTPKIKNPDTCACICPPGHAPCPSGYRWDAATCSCVCANACPVGATRSPGTCDCVCETLSVPADGSFVFTRLNTIAGRTYTIRVRGQVNLGHTIAKCPGARWWEFWKKCPVSHPADAEYRSVPSTNTMLADRCETDDIGLAIDSPAVGAKKPASWGPYRPDHVYNTTFTGSGKPFGFNFHECVGRYGDNSGRLTVEILCDCPAVQCVAPRVPSTETCQCVCPAHEPCADPKVFDDRTCQCVCPSHRPCQDGKRYDDDLCRCICSEREECPRGKRWNEDTCSCVCITPCRPPKVQNPRTCRCACPDHEPCPGGGVRPADAEYVYDEKTCTCVCAQSCPASGTRGADSCDCVCETIRVPADGTSVFSKLSTVAGQPYTVRVRGQVDVGDGTRPADAEYRSDPVTNAELVGRCRDDDIGLAIDSPAVNTKRPVSWGDYRPDHVYTTVVAGTGKPLGFNFHECVGRYADNTGFLTVEILCPRSGSTGTDPSGTAVAVETGEETPVPPTPDPVGTATTGGTSGTVVAEDIVTPAPPTPTPTPTPVVPPDCSDDDLECGGRCIPAAQCPPGSCCLDAGSCECLCPTCTEFEVFTPRECACECAIAGCPPNHAYDETACTCTCLETACPPNFGFDPASCACICIPVACPANFQFDPTSCSCVCAPPACPANFQVDAASCACVCVPPACPPNYQVDLASCSCFCAAVGCSEGEAFDPGSCVCLTSGGTGETQGSA